MTISKLIVAYNDGDIMPLVGRPLLTGKFVFISIAAGLFLGYFVPTFCKSNLEVLVLLSIFEMHVLESLSDRHNQVNHTMVIGQHIL